MAVPGFQDFMLPLLKHVRDGREHTLRGTVDALADQMNLTDADRRELLPSGTETRLYNRVQWASTHLKRAGLLSSPARGRFGITELGLGVLREEPPLINTAYLRRYPSFVSFVRGEVADGGNSSGTEPGPELPDDESPEEIMEAADLSLRRTLAGDLLEKIRAASPQFFEHLVIDLLVRMGYGGSRQDAGRAVGRSGDGGIDGIIKEDRLGLDAVYVQAKRWESGVGRPVVQAFAGSLEGHRAKKGVLITTSDFSAEARDYIQRIEKRIVLINGQLLAQLMIEHNVGVSEVKTFVVKKIDGDYFEEVE